MSAREARKDSSEAAREASRDRLEAARRAAEAARADSVACAAVRLGLQDNYNAIRANTAALKFELTVVDSGRSLVPPLYPLNGAWWGVIQERRPRQLTDSRRSLALLQAINRQTSFYIRMAEDREDFRAQNLMNMSETSLTRRLRRYDEMLIFVGTVLCDTLLVEHARLHGWTFE